MLHANLADEYCSRCIVSETILVASLKLREIYYNAKSRFFHRKDETLEEELIQLWNFKNFKKNNYRYFLRIFSIWINIDDIFITKTKLHGYNNFNFVPCDRTAFIPIVLSRSWIIDGPMKFDLCIPIFIYHYYQLFMIIVARLLFRSRLLIINLRTEY